MSQVIDPSAHTVASPSLDVVPDPPASVAMNPSAFSAYQSSVEVGSNDSVSGMVAASSDPNLSSVDWDFNEAIAWFDASS